MRVLDLFSGIGGFSLGLERSGMNTVAFCEIDPFCQSVLRKHWPGIPIHTDVRNLDGKIYNGRVDLICGGFPCQPFSQAGKQEGARDDRFIWPEMYRVIKGARPDWVLGENVSGLVNLELDSVLSDLEEAGYTTRAFIIPACGVDAPHRRNRTWIVAHCNNARQRSGQGSGCSRREGEEGDDVGRGGSSIPGARRDNPSPAIWGDEPRVPRISDGISRKMDRIRSLGNSVVPQIVEHLGRFILSAEAARD